MTTKTKVRAGGWMNNHNETLVRDKKTAGLKLKTRVRAGSVSFNFEKFKYEYREP